MKTLVQQLSQYAAYHRDKRNIATHFVGIPLIVFAVTVLLSRPAFEVAGLSLSPAVVVAMLTCLYYLKLDLRYGLVMSLLFAFSVYASAAVAAASTLVWLSAGLGLFVLGWIIQFIGHYYERRKPAFVDDLIGLAIGPLFVLAELGFLLGLRKEVEHAIIHNVGPTLIRTAADDLPAVR